MSIFEVWNIYQNRDTTRLRQSWITLLTWSILKGRGDSRGSGPIRNIATKNITSPHMHCVALGVIFHFTFLSDRSLGPTLFPNSIFLSVNVIQNFTHSDPVSGLVRRSKEHIRNHSVCHICVYFLRILG